jgi:hypothetical protein
VERATCQSTLGIPAPIFHTRSKKPVDKCGINFPAWSDLSRRDSRCISFQRRAAEREKMKNMKWDQENAVSTDVSK